MLDFSGKDQKAKTIALHYATQFVKDETLNKIIAGEREITRPEEAIALCEFFWLVVDQSAFDYENGIEVEGEIGVQFWVERLFNIIHGHLFDIGYEKEWDEVCDKN